jgi:hypothetical protein
MIKHKFYMDNDFAKIEFTIGAWKLSLHSHFQIGSGTPLNLLIDDYGIVIVAWE